jgi:hypothetical protein
MVSFRVGVEDAEFLEKEFTPVFSMYDLVNVEAFTCNLKLLIDNTASRPFNMKPIDAPLTAPLTAPVPAPRAAASFVLLGS